MKRKFKLLRKFEKEEYFNSNSPILRGIDLDIPDMGCSHCEKAINLRDFKVELKTIQPYKPQDSHGNPLPADILKRMGLDKQEQYSSEERELIVCPNAPECDGTVIDWCSMESINHIKNLEKNV